MGPDGDAVDAAILQVVLSSDFANAGEPELRFQFTFDAGGRYCPGGNNPMSEAGGSEAPGYAPKTADPAARCWGSAASAQTEGGNQLVHGWFIRRVGRRVPLGRVVPT
jgi:hypothetical protein